MRFTADSLHRPATSVRSAGMPASDTRTRSTAVGAGSASRRSPERDARRLGLSVPHEWWPSASLLKSYEAAGFSWVQLHSPPTSVLRDPRALRRHAGAARASLET